MERCSSVDWNVSFSVMWCGGTRSPSANSVVYQLAPIVNVDSSLLVTQFCSPSKIHFVEHPLASFTRFLTNHLTQTFTVFGSVLQLFSMSSLKTNWFYRDFFTQLIQKTTQVTLTLLQTLVYWLTSWCHTSVRSLIGWRGCHSNSYLTFHQSSMMTIDLSSVDAIAIVACLHACGEVT